MKLRRMIVSVGLSMSLGAHAAFAAPLEQQPAPVGAGTATDTPWHQRFTLSTGATGAWGESNTRAELSWQPSVRWGVTLNVRDGDRSAIVTEDEASVGAFYQFTPRLRVGGALSVASQRSNALGDPVRAADERDASAGVKLESAFRF